MRQLVGGICVVTPPGIARFRECVIRRWSTEGSKPTPFRGKKQSMRAYEP